MCQSQWEVRVYEDEKGRYPFEEWRLSLDAKTRARVSARINRIRGGNFGDRKSLGQGLYELRFFFGAGYRVYYATLGQKVILLLSGGDKKSQSKDIKMAREMWDRYQS